MKQTWKQLVTAMMGLALVLPAAVAFSQDVRANEPLPDTASQVSPSDMPPPQPMTQPARPRQVQRMPSQYAGNSCCGSGNVVYSPGYATAQAMPRYGYRGYDYYYGDRCWYGERIYRGANWDRHHESDRTNFSGSYGSKASLYSGRW